MRSFQSETSVKTSASKAEALSGAIIKASFQLPGQHKNSMKITSYPYYIRAPCVLVFMLMVCATSNEGSALSFQKAKLRIE